MADHERFRSIEDLEASVRGPLADLRTGTPQLPDPGVVPADWAELTWLLRTAG